MSTLIFSETFTPINKHLNRQWSIKRSHEEKLKTKTITDSNIKGIKYNRNINRCHFHNALSDVAISNCKTAKSVNGSDIESRLSTNSRKISRIHYQWYSTPMMMHKRMTHINVTASMRRILTMYHRCWVFEWIPKVEDIAMILEENMSRNVYAHTYNLESAYLKLIKISIINQSR